MKKGKILGGFTEEEAKEMFSKLDWYGPNCDVRFIEGKYYPEYSWGRLNGGQWGCNNMGKCAVIIDGVVRDITGYPEV
jgi:hypothetical protein